MAKFNPPAKAKLSFLTATEETQDEQQSATPLEVSPYDIAANPFQPRSTYDPAPMAELVASVQQHGIIEPLVVRPAREGGYILVAGSRRLNAAKQAGLNSVPVVIKEYDDEQAEIVSLVENLQRQELGFAEEAVAFLAFKSRTGCTNARLGKLIGKSTDYVEDRVYAAENKAALDAYLAGNITMEQMRSYNPLTADQQTITPSADSGSNARQRPDPYRPLNTYIVRAERLVASKDRLKRDPVKLNKAIAELTKTREAAQRVSEQMDRAIDELSS